MIVIFLNLIQVMLSQLLSSLKLLGPLRVSLLVSQVTVGPILAAGGLWAPRAGCGHIRAWRRVPSCWSSSDPLMNSPSLALSLLLFPLSVV